MAPDSSAAQEYGRPVPQGRPRLTEVDQAILSAALRLIARDGYVGMTMDGVAEEAGVSKATIYLRFRHKPDLATAAIGELKVRPAPEETGDLVADLRSRLTNWKRSVHELGLQIVGTMLTEEQRHPEFLQLLRERIMRPRRRLIREVLQHAIDRGEVRPDADLEVVIEMLFGSFYARQLAGADADTWPDDVIQTVLPGLARASGDQRPR